jgi:hypothetical protein
MAREVSISLRGVLEELPSEVAELLMATLRKIGDTEHLLNNVIERLEKEEEVGHCVVDLETIRKSFYGIDIRLSDCLSILSAYLQHINNPDQAPQAPPPLEESED